MLSKSQPDLIFINIFGRYCEKLTFFGLVSALGHLEVQVKLQFPTQVIALFPSPMCDFWNFAGSGLAGMKQGDLIVWYVEQQNAQGAYSSTDEVREEVKCIKAIIEVYLTMKNANFFGPCCTW